MRPRRVVLMGAVVLRLALPSPAQAQTEVVEYYGTDALGSVRVVFDASGTVIARTDYQPFGDLSDATGGLPATLFTGQERDTDAALDYFGARFYQPRHGRFTTVDPVFGTVADPQQGNRYTYARNNPLTFTDPDGRNLDVGLVCTVYNGERHCAWQFNQSSGGGVGGVSTFVGFAGSTYPGGPGGSAEPRPRGGVDLGGSVAQQPSAGTLPSTPLPTTEPLTGVESPTVKLPASTDTRLKEALGQAVRDMDRRLDRHGCGEFYGGGEFARSVLWGTNYRFAAPAFFEQGGAPSSVAAATIGRRFVYIKHPGQFMAPPPQWGGLPPLSPDLSRALIIGHELGHSVGRFGGDLDLGQNKAHTLGVYRACF